MHATTIYATMSVDVNVKDPCRKGLSFMTDKNITLKLTEKELGLLKESVSWSCKNKHDRLLEACEGGYWADDGYIHIEPSRYEEYFDYIELSRTLNDAGSLPF